MESETLWNAINRIERKWEKEDRAELRALLKNKTLIKVLAAIFDGTDRVKAAMFTIDFSDSGGLAKAAEYKGVAHGLTQAIEAFSTLSQEEEPIDGPESASTDERADADSGAERSPSSEYEL